ncbi:MAG: ATP-binding protein [Nitrospinota bacterium]|nr:ATP-binding protein [Nitrospinota bacterium]
MTPPQGKAANPATPLSKSREETPNPKEMTIESRNQPSPGICKQCQGSHYVLVNVDSFVHAELCSCFNCSKCQGRGHIFLEDEKGISSMAECECARLVRRLKKLGEAGIPGKFTGARFETYQPMDASQKLALRIARDFVEDHGSNVQGLLFMGRPGLGKTHLAVSVIKELILNKGEDCKFIDFFQLLSDIRNGYSQDLSEQAIINPYVAAPVLVIDELAKGRNTEWELTMLDQIISSRYNAADKITLLTTNYTDDSAIRKSGKKETHVEFGSSSGRKAQTGEETLQDKVGERIYSRLVEMCRLVKLKGEDYRMVMEDKAAAPPRPAKKTNRTG